MIGDVHWADIGANDLQTAREDPIELETRNIVRRTAQRKGGAKPARCQVFDGAAGLRVPCRDGYKAGDPAHGIGIEIAT